ncbi:ADP-ribosylglycohydrolase family protein [Streptomyces sp. NPDC060232]|uniref:ADP-ribosylglycohydrolase family protein n=1 Tax=Streptomyces sp. NPDC060232 TaxID=3347079 RepID=UPI0036474F8B
MGAARLQGQRRIRPLPDRARRRARPLNASGGGNTAPPEPECRGPGRPGCADRAPEPLWRWSDDIAQALAPVRELAEGGGTIDQDRLALRLAEAYADDTHRGYGASMHDVLRRFGAGEPWRAVDTTCAIAGGVIAARTGVPALPPPWHAAREPLPGITRG